MYEKRIEVRICVTGATVWTGLCSYRWHWKSCITVRAVKNGDSRQYCSRQMDRQRDRETDEIQSEQYSAWALARRPTMFRLNSLKKYHLFNCAAHHAAQRTYDHWYTAYSSVCGPRQFVQWGTDCVGGQNPTCCTNCNSKNGQWTNRKHAPTQHVLSGLR